MDALSPVDALTKRELEVMDRVDKVVGTIEAKFDHLRENGTFAESASIHAAYVDLAAAPAKNLEALKRAVFIGWYEQSEPGCFTGIRDLDETQVKRAHELLEATWAAGKLDREFQVMLGWYWFHTDYLFRPYSSSAFIEYLSTLHPNAYQEHGFHRNELERRGQMGRYWVSIACRAA